MLLWSVARRWSFPAPLPSKYSIDFWQQEWSSLYGVITQSLAIAFIAACIAVIMAIIVHEYRLNTRAPLPSLVFIVPILIPQLAILLGLQAGIIYFDTQAYAFWVCWSHVFFAFPYVYLGLYGAWQSYDMRLTQTALSLGKSPMTVWFRVKLPQLLPAITIAWAVAVSVSLAQYLPTLMLGAGRIMTLTTEAVALSSGFDRRITAIYALWQALLPLIFFFAAIVVSQRFGKKHRADLKEQTSDDTYFRQPQHL